MTYPATQIRTTSALTPSFPALAVLPDLSRVRELLNSDREEALAFLAIRPVHTVVMTSFINDNGVESELNRGRFFGYRNDTGMLEGVALIGHTTLVEARSEQALEALAIVARSSETPIHLVMSGGDDAERFWYYFGQGIRAPRLVCTEDLFEARFPFAVQRCEWDIKQADMSQLMPIAEAQAEIAFIECGIDPMLQDREGFLERVARRIEQGRIFSVYENGKLLFKADIIAETDQTIYLEGIYVHPDERGKGLGSKCLAALTVELLDRVEHICLLSNVEFQSAHTAYEKAGYGRTDQCVSIFA